MNNQSFSEIATSYQPLIKGQIRALRIYKDHDHYYQTGLIALWEAYQRYNPEKGNFGAFAKYTVRGKLLDELKKEKRYGDYQEVGCERLVERMIDETAITPLENDIINVYLSDLSFKERQWVVQAILLQMKPNEIAAAEGISIETVKSRRKQAMKKLRQIKSV